LQIDGKYRKGNETPDYVQRRNALKDEDDARPLRCALLRTLAETKEPFLTQKSPKRVNPKVDEDEREDNINNLVDLAHRRLSNSQIWACRVEFDRACHRLRTGRVSCGGTHHHIVCRQKLEDFHQNSAMI